MVRTRTHEKKYKNQWMTVFEDEIELPNGHKGIYGYVERKPGAGAVIINNKDEVLLVKQYRYPIKDFQINIPGGGIDIGEDDESALKREIKEETGLEIEIIKKLGKFYPLSSCSTEVGHLFLCRTTSRISKERKGESDETFESIFFVGFEEALRMIDEGEITDDATANAIQIAYRDLNRD